MICWFQTAIAEHVSELAGDTRSPLGKSTPIKYIYFCAAGTLVGSGTRRIGSLYVDTTSAQGYVGK